MLIRARIWTDCGGERCCSSLLEAERPFCGRSTHRSGGLSHGHFTDCSAL